MESLTKSELKESLASKKFWFAILAIVSCFVYAAIANDHMVKMYEQFTGVVEFVTAGYLVGNVANKWVLGKTKKKTPKIETK